MIGLRGFVGKGKVRDRPGVKYFIVESGGGLGFCHEFKKDQRCTLFGCDTPWRVLFYPGFFK